MKYKEAMNMKCSCGKQNIGGWQGTPRKGVPLFSKVSLPMPTEFGVMCEEHTRFACYKPCRIEKH